MIGCRISGVGTISITVSAVAERSVAIPSRHSNKGKFDAVLS
tara:strand:+ start:1104 stop:1229 length:126 start_codon:yes stop_codon:yes gene_type:complete